MTRRCTTALAPSRSTPPSLEKRDGGAFLATTTLFVRHPHPSLRRRGGLGGLDHKILFDTPIPHSKRETEGFFGHHLRPPRSTTHPSLKTQDGFLGHNPSFIFPIMSLSIRQDNLPLLFFTSRKPSLWVGKVERRGWAIVPIPQNSTFFFPNTCIGTNKAYSTTGIARQPRQPPATGEFSCLLPFHSH